MKRSTTNWEVECQSDKYFSGFSGPQCFSGENRHPQPQKNHSLAAPFREWNMVAPVAILQA
jgi:hypothetical protein